MANLVLRDVVTEYGKAEAGLRHRLELAEAREEQARERSRERARHAKKRRKRGEADRMNDVDGQENGGGIEERGTSPDVVCLDDQAGSDEDGSPCSASACVSEDDSLSSGEEYDPRDRGKKDAQGRDAVKSGEAKAGTGGTGGTAGPGTTASSFMACPICGKNVHHMYMNSHIDACLVGGGRSGSGKVDRERAAAQPALVVPPKLVLLGALNNSSNEKKLKNELKKYNISTEGCASARELLDRYMRFRTAVEVSNDKGEEGASYEKIVFRMMKEERSKKMAGMFGGRRSSRAEGTAGAANPIGEPCAAQCQRVCGQDGQPSLTLAPIAWTKSNTSKKKVVIDMTGDVAREGGLLTEAPRRFDPSQINLSEIRHPREILLPEDATFEEMVAVTRLRDRVRIMLLKEFNDV